MESGDPELAACDLYTERRLLSQVLAPPILELDKKGDFSKMVTFGTGLGINLCTGLKVSVVPIIEISD